MSIDVKDILIDNRGIDPTEFGAEARVKNMLEHAGVEPGMGPAAWEENGKIHVGTSSIHRVSRPGIYPHGSNDDSQRVIVSGSSVSEAWEQYEKVLCSSEENCFRIGGANAPKYVRFVNRAKSALTQA